MNHNLCQVHNANYTRWIKILLKKPCIQKINIKLFSKIKNLHTKKIYKKITERKEWYFFLKIKMNIEKKTKHLSYEHGQRPKVWGQCAFYAQCPTLAQNTKGESTLSLIKIQALTTMMAPRKHNHKRSTTNRRWRYF